MSKSDDFKIPKQIHRFMGVDREYIEWFPTIIYEKCNHCGDCVEFCAHGVYKMEDGKLIVENPKNCVVFCQACMKMCPLNAMLFQGKKDVLNQIKKIKVELKKNN